MAMGVKPLVEAAPALPANQPDIIAGMPRRMMGRTGIKVSIVGFSGLALNKRLQEDCNQGVKNAFDKGVNYFDVAPAYGDAEVRMGGALEQLKRSEYFLACKTKARDAKGAQEELDRSLQRLKTDYFDVYQLHHIQKPEQVKQALGPGGCMETILKAKEQGKIRFIGFSAHTTQGAMEALKGFKFDTVMFPINFVEYYTIGFGRDVLAEAKKQGAAVLAIKPMSTGLWPKGAEQSRKWWYRSAEEKEQVDLVMRWALSQAPVVTTFSPGFLDLVDKAIESGKNFRPITEKETAQLQELAKSCNTMFKREEDAVAMGHPLHFADLPVAYHEYRHS
jgi:predicted aldo/keto reductase-like oxidoreductase